MITIKDLSYDALFVKFPKIVVEYIAGIAFGEDRTVSIILTDEVNWKLVTDSVGGIHFFSGECGEKWKEVFYLERGDFRELTI